MGAKPQLLKALNWRHKRCMHKKPNVLLVFIKFNIRQNITNFLFKIIPKEVRIFFFQSFICFSLTGFMCDWFSKDFFFFFLFRFYLYTFNGGLEYVCYYFFNIMLSFFISFPKLSNLVFFGPELLWKTEQEI
jgi:hypothetical protein